MKSRLFAGDRQNRVIQDYQTLMQMMESAFGSSEGGKPSQPRGKVVATEADMLQFMQGFN